MKKLTQTAFTIIELLIVIVVIGILATLVLNVIQDADDRANNARTIDTAGKYIDALIAYSVDNGEHLNPDPTDPNTRVYCLGTGYSDDNNDGIGECFYLWPPSQPPGAGATYDEDPTIAQPLIPYLGNELPPIVTDKVEAYVGPPRYYYWGAYLIINPNQVLANGDPATHVLQYYLDGEDLDCGASPLIEGVVGAPGVPTVDYVTDRKYTWSVTYTFSGNQPVTTCQILLRPV